MSKAKKKNSYHFIANPSDAESVKLQEKMIKTYGQADSDKATVTCAIGGDGSLLYALRDAFNKTVLGQCLTDSNSVGFWMNRVDADNSNLESLIENAHSYALKPLRVEIHHDDGSKTIKHAFTDAALASNNGQASLAYVQDMDLDVDDNDWRVMGNGLTFATPFGSTAKSYAENGSALDLSLAAFILTGSAVCSPLNFKSYVYPADARLFVKMNASRAKRDQRIDIDGVTYQPPEGKNVVGFEITTAKDKQATLLLDRPARTAFKKLTIDV